VLARLKGTHPAIKAQLYQGLPSELVPRLVAGELDLIVGRLYRPPVPDGLTREHLWSDPVSVLARSQHPIFAAPMTVESLRRYELLLPTVGQRLGQDVEHVAAKLGLEPTAPLRSNSDVFIREMLCATDCIAIMPRLAFIGDVRRGTLRAAALPIAVPDRPAGVVLPRNRALSSAAQVFVQSLRSYIDDSAGFGVSLDTGRADETRMNGAIEPADEF
jgi:LysR family pca operon transcriptional activator